ncbi:MAG TPA: hypothetical protein VLC91_08045 [Spongiibacteraceae bacterium]|nr:hypothetical protein [Spongiibacteraceae bacterium]
MLGASYFFAIDKLALVNTPFGKSYRQFLLTATDAVPERIIIESGSNSLHSIDAQMLEQHFGRPTIIIADNAGYPLRHKIERLANHLKKDDLVIMPLEWLQYRTDAVLPKDYVLSLLDQEGSNAFYYRELPWLQKLRFVYQSVPFRLGLQRIFSLNGLASANEQIGAASNAALARFDQAIRMQSRGSELTDTRPVMDALTAGISCDHYLFGFWTLPTISDTFRENLQLLARLRQTSGAKILFAWPVVVARDNDECYQLLREPIRDHVAQIKELVEQQGFSFVGSPEQSRYDHNCMLDTYYHITASCAVIHTQKLITWLDQQGVARESGFEQLLMEQHLLDFLQSYRDVPPSSLPPIAPRIKPFHHLRQRHIGE